MASRQLDEEAIFHVARDIANPETRSRYLDQVCAGDAHLRSRVVSLLEVHEKEQDFLKSTPGEPDPTVDQSPLTERPGTTIGRYRLMEQVGEGGMGVVFVAEQERPVRRKVALKIIKPGMDTREVVARFEAERQALALMDHPNIAKVLDAGSTDSERPYFVMELVRGIPITEYCDQAKLSIRERLELFIQACQAVQHAHQKGIIHRDLKPSNVLVTLHDGKPVPKIIDFGVAKATNQRLTERTIYTRFAQIIGTPMYMSPEQAELSGLDVDTRSDIYSLGVLLYELLTGTTPFDRERLRSAAYDEMRRIIREEEPPKPSTKISSLGTTATTVSSQRKTDPRKLHQLVRGDLDWIVMKAMEKDRTRRFETASGLAADVQRFLCCEPIEARPPSTTYRLRKVAARHRAAVGMTIVMLAMLIGGIAIMTWLAILKNEQRNAAEASADQLSKARAQLEAVLIDSVIGAAFNGRVDETNRSISNARRAGIDNPRIRMMSALAELYAGETATSLAHLDELVKTEPTSVTAWSLYAIGNHISGNIEQYGLALVNLENLIPSDDYDRVFKGNAIARAYPALGAVEMRAAVGKQPSWIIARVLLASGLSYLAMDRDELTSVEDAISRLNWAKEAQAGSPFLATVELEALTVAIVLGDRSGKDVSAWRREAAELARRLRDEYGTFLAGRIARARYFMALDDLENAEQEWAIAAAVGQGDWIRSSYRAVLLRRRKYEAVIGFFGQDPHAYVLSGDRDAAIAACDQFDKTQPATLLWVWNQYSRRLCGQEEIAIQNLRSLDCSRQPPWISNPVRLFCGEISSANLLKEAGESHLWQSHAHHCIALDYLARGDREKAKEHFRLSTSPGNFLGEVHQLSLAFLERMEDPKWPEWIEPVPSDSAD